MSANPNKPLQIPISPRQPCIAILGPTCSGKSSLAMKVAEAVNGHIVSCDSMQIYRGMNIGTATPEAGQLNRVPHHLINELDIEQRYDAYRFLKRAAAVFNELSERHPPSTPILVGGTGLYAKALIYGFEMQPSDPRIYREVLDEFNDGAGEAYLRSELLAMFPDTPASTLANPRRLMRALEIKRLGGNPFAVRQNQTRPRPLPGFLQFVVLPPPHEQEISIQLRTEQMLKHGWIEETEVLMSKGFLETPTARQALGYKEIADFIRGDIPDKERLLAKLITKTRQYARKQRTWFRHQHPGAYILTHRGGLSSDDLASAILSQTSVDCPTLDERIH